MTVKLIFGQHHLLHYRLKLLSNWKLIHMMIYTIRTLSSSCWEFYDHSHNRVIRSGYETKTIYSVFDQNKLLYYINITPTMIRIKLSNYSTEIHYSTRPCINSIKYMIIKNHDQKDIIISWYKTFTSVRSKNYHVALWRQ